ncbi:MAG: hypothetical protein ACOYBY_16785 [Dermatophilaceae bacterium]
MSEHIDAIAHLQKAARPSRHVPADNGALRPKAPTPTLPTPAIARPTVWAASQMSYEEVLDAVRDLELANGVSSPKFIRRQLLFAETLLGWLLKFPGESWQQRWHASGADAAGKNWTALADDPDRHGYLVAAAGRLLLLDAIRPDYSWLYVTHAAPKLYERLRARRDPAGFATIERLCDTDARMLPSDRRDALAQLTRMLVHNGGTLGDITSPWPTASRPTVHKTATAGESTPAGTRCCVMARSCRPTARRPYSLRPTRAADHRGDGRPLRRGLPPDQGPVRRLPVRTPSRHGLQLDPLYGGQARAAVLARPGDSRARHRLPAPVRRGDSPLEDEA